MHIRQAEVSEAITTHSNVHLDRLRGADCSWSSQHYTMYLVQTCLYCPLRYLTSLVLFCVRAIGRESTNTRNNSIESKTTSLDNPRRNAIDAMKSSVTQERWERNSRFTESLRKKIKTHPICEHPILDLLGRA